MNTRVAFFLLFIKNEVIEAIRRLTWESNGHLKSIIAFQTLTWTNPSPGMPKIINLHLMSGRRIGVDFSRLAVVIIFVHECWRQKKRFIITKHSIIIITASWWQHILFSGLKASTIVRRREKQIYFKYLLLAHTHSLKMNEVFALSCFDEMLSNVEKKERTQEIMRGSWRILFSSFLFFG